MNMNINININSLFIVFIFIPILTLFSLSSYANEIGPPSAVKNFKQIDLKRKSLEAKVQILQEEEMKSSNRLDKSNKIITNYTRQVNYAEKELTSNFFVNNCNIGNSELTNLDMGLENEHDSKIVKFSFQDKFIKSGLTLKDLRYGSIKAAGIVEILKSESEVEIKIYNRKNDNFLVADLIAKFQDSNGICEQKILLTFAHDKDPFYRALDKDYSPPVLETILSPDAITEMKTIDFRYSIGVEEQLEVELSLLKESKDLFNKLNLIKEGLKNKSSDIVILSRSIRFAKKIFDQDYASKDASFCFQDNFHLRNTDFDLPDLFQGLGSVYSIDLDVGNKYTVKDLSLISLKLKEFKFAGIANLEHRKNSDIDRYSLQLYERNKKMKSVELRAEFKRKNGELCQADIRFSFFPVSVNLSFLDKFESISVLGKIGNDTEEFQLPYGSAFYNNAIFMTDCINAKIQVFDKSGRFLYSFGERGTHSGQIYTTPADLQVHDGSIYIAEGWNHRIEQFSLSGDFQRSWGTYGDATKNQSSMLGKFNVPFGIDFIDDMMIVSEHFNYRVQAIDVISGKTRWVSINSDGDDFDWMEPYYLKADPARNLIYVVGRTRNWVGVLNLKGEKQYTFGNDVFNYPHELDVGPDGKIYIADSKNYRLVIYDSPDDKEYETLQFSSSFGYLKTVAVDKDGSLAIGFNDGESAYVLLLSSKESSLKKPGKDVLEAQKEAILKNKIKSEVVYEESSMMRTERLYTENCAGCHEDGSFGAPSRGDRESWDRFPRSPQVLLDLAWEGNGAMQSKGGCDECTNNDLQELIKYMAPMNWLGAK